MTSVRERLMQWPWLPGLDRGGLITGLLGLLLGGLYLIPISVEGRADSGAGGGQIPCARLRGQPMGTCSFSLGRPGEGESFLRVIHANGMERKLVFRGDTFTGCQMGREGCGGLRVQTAWEEKLHLLRVGHERYEIPSSVLQGK